MASASTVHTNLSAVLQRKLDVGCAVESLEQRAVALEYHFKAILQKAQELLWATTRYVDKQETEFECWKLLETILAAGGDSRDILDHVRVFFQLVLAQMKIKGADIHDVKMLWHLHDNDGVHETFVTAVSQFGFGAQDLHNLKLLLALTYKLQIDMERDICDGLIDADVTEGAFDCDMADRFYLENKELEHVLRESMSMLGNLTTDTMQDLLSYVQGRNELKEDKTDHGEVGECTVHDAQAGGDRAATTDVTDVPSHVQDKSIENPAKSSCQETPMKPSYQEPPMTSSCLETPMKTPGCLETPMKTPGCLETPMKLGCLETPLKPGCLETPMKLSCQETPLKLSCQETPMKPGCLETPMKPGCLETPMKSSTTHLTTPLRSASKLLPDKRVLTKTLHTWGVDPKLQETILKIMYTVLWVLNVGRKDKNLSILNR